MPSKKKQESRYDRAATTIKNNPGASLVTGIAAAILFTLLIILLLVWVASVKADNGDLQGQLTSAHNLASGLKQEKDELFEKIDSLRSTISRLQGVVEERNELRVKLASLTAELECARTLYREVQDRYAAVQEELLELRAGNTRWREQCEELSGELAEARVQIEILELQLAQVSRSSDPWAAYNQRIRQETIELMRQPHQVIVKRYIIKKRTAYNPCYY